MKNPEELYEQVRRVIEQVERHDPQLAEELNDKRESASFREEASSLDAVPEFPTSALEGGGPSPSALETIVFRTGRPVLAVSRNEPELTFQDAESEIWRDRLTEARSLLVTAIQAVGRIELRHHPFFEWVGTGWLVDEDLIVTNRHVAEVFARHEGTRFVFRRNVIEQQDMEASIDFLEEIGRPEDLTFELQDIFHIENDAGPDIALLQVTPRDDVDLATRIDLTDRPPAVGDEVAVIGYPARDSRIPDQALMQQIFGNVYDKKRLAPGQVSRLRSDALLHDCSTLGGNSGSVVLDLKTGRAVGLHFAGRFLEANFAVPAQAVARRVQRHRNERFRSKVAVPPQPRMDAAPATTSTPYDARPQQVASVSAASVHTFNLMLPINVTVEIGTPAAGAGQTGGNSRAAAFAPLPDTGDIERVGSGGDPADLQDRAGYDPDFLGNGFHIPLPQAGSRWQNDLLTFDIDDGQDHELRYQHFSVVMSRCRRLCLFSAVNIDGASTVRKSRVSWRFDPRIPQEVQIAEECYGNPPRFSRGHMTRRLDPVWGSNDDATKGNRDSMHVTNAVPQMQPFNADIWLELEDFALENADRDNQRINVFTGPVMRPDDPFRFGVQIPRTFWKVISFVHDEARTLSATGYMMSQEDFLRDEEFVFGAFVNSRNEITQRPIALIEEMAGLSFGNLSVHDPLNTVEEGLVVPLTDYRQIRLV